MHSDDMAENKKEPPELRIMQHFLEGAIPLEVRRHVEFHHVERDGGAHLQIRVRQNAPHPEQVEAHLDEVLAPMANKLKVLDANTGEMHSYQITRMGPSILAGKTPKDIAHMPEEKLLDAFTHGRDIKEVPTQQITAESLDVTAHTLFTPRNGRSR